MTVAHVNFFENLHEAHFRLRGTVVVYDKLPYYVMAITDHKKDGIFRIYLDPVGIEKHPLPSYNDFNPEQPELGPYLDKWMEANKSSPIIRKQMNSPLFDKYRPFPLGMANISQPGGGWSGAVYLERQPQRKSEQGLTQASTYYYVLSASQGRGGAVPAKPGTYNVQLMSQAMRCCILAEHPSAKDCLENLLNPKIENEAVAFDRHFALVRGPMDMMFLGYKSDIVGILPNTDFSQVKLGRKFTHCREVVEKLGLFKSVTAS